MSATSITLQAKLAVTAVAVGGTAAVAGLGTFGAFTSTTDASAGVSTGTVALELGTPGTAANRLTVGASGLVPGDRLERAVQLKNSGTEALSDLTLTTTASASSLLDTDTTTGLRLVVDRCSVAWTESATPPYLYTCGGTTTSVVADRAAVGSAIDLDGPALVAGATDHLRVRLALPAAAGNPLQNKTSTLVFTFDGLQRTATDQ